LRQSLHFGVGVAKEFLHQILDVREPRSSSTFLPPVKFAIEQTMQDCLQQGNQANVFVTCGSIAHSDGPIEQYT
jgi:hypothetical protein